MPLFSAHRDFLNTLRVVPGVWNKLHYLATHRFEDCYEHWGLVQIHGQEATIDAMREVHRILVSETLRRSFPELVADLELLCEQEGNDAMELIAEMIKRGELSLPPATSAVSSEHFNYVMSVVSSLLKARKLSTRPIS